ncbi:MAG: hypothetical protein M1812_004778 [Candelaria pacifica]|nr:MAG: hypothetical protein M1812_004778 [Candelaria pacifica]
MARGKTASGRGRSRGGGRGSLHNSFVSTSSFVTHSGESSAGISKALEQPQFSLRDEARHTDHHHSRLQSGLKLRHTKVSFVSGGDLHTEQLDHDEIAPATLYDQNALTVNASGHWQPTISELSLDDEANSKEGVTALKAGFSKHEPPANGESFFVDTTGSRPMETGLPAPTVRSLSPTPSDSSEEIILFAGRNFDDSRVTGRESNDAISRTLSSTQNSAGLRQSQQPLLTLGATGRKSRREDVSLFSSGASNSSELHTSRAAQRSGRLTLPPSNSMDMIHEQGSSPNRSQSRPSSVLIPDMPYRCRKRRRRYGKVEEDNEDDAVLADYIANMLGSDESEVDSSQLHEAMDAGVSVSGSSQTEHRLEVQGLLAWDRSELCDFDDLSTSDEVLGTIQLILSKRERATGTQYLIVWEGYTVDDARWTPSSLLTVEGAAEKILLFENRMKLSKRSLSKDDYNDDSSAEEDKIDFSTDEESEDLKDEQDLSDRRLASLTDEQIARLLSKQEELGMGSKELMLCDAIDNNNDSNNDSDGDGENDAHNEGKFMFNNDLGMRDLSRSSRSRGPGTRKSTRQFPSATVLADVLDLDGYHGFDVMDYARPSLKNKSKNRRGALPFQLSDSDLEVSLQAAWENDRNTKKAKKKVREEHRAQGLLGVRSKRKPNMRVRYKEGMTMNDVKSEIKSFLISEHQSLPLPPLDKRDRKTVHEIANIFKLKSKSVGQGPGRFPILYKTSRSASYDENALEMIQARLDQRRFLPRADKRGTKNQFIPRGTGGGASSAAVSYMDGDVVGAAAPELGTENRGRAMLERMGWSTGTALGALNNKGILQPVAHVVKTTKAGLG